LGIQPGAVDGIAAQQTNGAVLLFGIGAPEDNIVRLAQFLAGADKICDFSGRKKVPERLNPSPLCERIATQAKAAICPSI